MPIYPTYYDSYNIVQYVTHIRQYSTYCIVFQCIRYSQHNSIYLINFIVFNAFDECQCVQCMSMHFMRMYSILQLISTPSLVLVLSSASTIPVRSIILSTALSTPTHLVLFVAFLYLRMLVHLLRASLMDLLCCQIGQELIPLRAWIARLGRSYLLDCHHWTKQDTSFNALVPGQQSATIMGGPSRHKTYRVYRHRQLRS